MRTKSAVRFRLPLSGYSFRSVLTPDQNTSAAAERAGNHPGRRPLRPGWPTTAAGAVPAGYQNCVTDLDLQLQSPASCPPSAARNCVEPQPCPARHAYGRPVPRREQSAALRRPQMSRELFGWRAYRRPCGRSPSVLLRAGGELGRGLSHRLDSPSPWRASSRAWNSARSAAAVTGRPASRGRSTSRFHCAR